MRCRSGLLCVVVLRNCVLDRANRRSDYLAEFSGIRCDRPACGLLGRWVLEHLSVVQIKRSHGGWRALELRSLGSTNGPCVAFLETLPNRIATVQSVDIRVDVAEVLGSLGLIGFEE